MNTAAIENEIFNDETKAREWLEAELWPHGPACPHCGVLNRATKVQGKSHRPGLYMCNECREQFTVTIGTVMEKSHIPLNKWMLAIFLLSASKKGMSTHQLHRMLGVSYKSAWFMMHRIREGMREGQLAPMGGAAGPSKPTRLSSDVSPASRRSVLIITR
jgi:transposase-like protein